MGWLFPIGIAVVVIGAIISSIKKGVAESKKTTQSIEHQPAKKNRSIDLFDEIKNSVAKKTTAKKDAGTSDEAHRHPGAAISVRTEKAAVEDSIGNFQSEGCAEHYLDRYVTIPEKPKDKKINEELARIIVLGEVLNNPGFKKYRRK